jgi:hypothetical protein
MMSKFSRALITISIASGLVAVPLLAKRTNPEPVAPVVAGGVRYSASGDGRDQYVVAEEVSNGKLLWKTKVFHNRIKFWVEEDVQWVFITNLKLVGDSIFVRDEQVRCYSIDLKRKHVKKQNCDGIFAQWRDCLKFPPPCPSGLKI